MIIDEVLIRLVYPMNHLIPSIKKLDETTFPCFVSLRVLPRVSNNEDWANAEVSMQNNDY